MATHFPSTNLRRFFDERNRSIRIDLFEELSDQALAAIRSFTRRLGAPHLLDEVILPKLNEGDSRLLVAVQDRPWPPWGLGARHVVALCQTHLIGDESYAISPVYVTDQDLTNIGMISAVFKEALDQVTVSPRAEIVYLVAEGSTLVDRVLTNTAFRKSDDVFVTWAGRYHMYRALASDVLTNLGLDKLSTPDLLAHDLEPGVLDKNALYHGTLYLGSRAEWAVDQVISEIIGAVRGAAAGKPGGVPGGTGQWAFDPGDLVEVQIGNILTPVEVQDLLNYLVANERNFTTATVLQAGAAATTVNEKLRRARTLDNLGKFGGLITEKIKQNLQPTLQKLGHKEFPLGKIEIQATASNDGDYFRLHPDSDPNDTRELSFVYFLNFEPRRFSGGELRIFATKVIDGQVSRADHSHTLSPRHNSMVFFPSMNQHEVLPVRVPTKDFRHGRFTINGWIHRAT
jgi:Rps23 Pro-64 3,4-dihydroxylase Tpa1-like proline 4-hydroxylase